MTIHLRKIRSYSRRIGKTLRTEPKNLIENLLPTITFDQPIKADCVVLDIGFGTGDQLAENAFLHPEKLFIGCEPFINGVANLLKLIRAKTLKNIQIWPNDVHDLLPKLPGNYLKEVYVLFPDPWPKTRQNKRRIINHNFLDLIATKMKEQGKIYIATDHQEYAEWILEHLTANPHWQDTNERIFPEDWVKSRYQIKAEAAGLKPFFFCFTKCH